MKHATRILIAAALVLFGTAAWPFADGFEASALEPSDIKAISIDAAPAVSVQNVKVDTAGLLTAVKVGPPVPPIPVCRAIPAGWTPLTKNNRKLTWPAVFYEAEWPGPWQPLAPVGSWTDGGQRTPYKAGPDILRRYLSIPFVLKDGAVHEIAVNGSQPIQPIRNYPGGQDANSTQIAISKCPGDVLAYKNWRSECAATGALPRLTYGAAVPGPCGFKQGDQLYLTIHFTDADTNVTTCNPRNNSGGKKCDANFKSK